MIEKIAMWGGFAGVIIALVAMIVLFLTRQNILDILDKDVILFDKNFELKKQAIERAMLMADELEEKGTQTKSNLEYVETAKKTYNELLCVVSNVRVADEFYNLIVDQTSMPTATQFAHFKLLCRHDIGLSNKKAKVLKRAKATESAVSEIDKTSPLNPSFDRPERPMPYTQPRPIQPQQPMQPTQPMQRPQRPMPPRPVQPIQQSQPMQQSQPVNRPVARPSQPKDNGQI